MSVNEDPNVVSAFGHVVDNTKGYMPPKSDPPAAEAAPAESKPEAAAESKPEAPSGPGDVQQQAEGGQKPGAEPQAAAGGNDLLSSMAAQLQQLTQQLNSAPAGAEQAQPGQDPLVQLDEQLAALQQQATAGEITYEEMIVQTAPIIEQRATLNIQRNMEQQAQQRQVQDAQGQFLQQYPDFQQFAQSPEANALVQQNPVFDHVSAYFATREQKQAAENQQLQAQIAELQGQIQKSIKGAATTQGAVVGGEAGDIGVPTLYRGDGLDQQKGGIAALRRARSTQQN